jgi:crotonobetainyl-CoA:carnitine CoA-transferase CaiB-like acyl-CoA transferase
MRPLDGISVVSLEQAVAAPFASRQLADLGARVIKIERPGSGDFARDYDRTVKGLCSHFVWLNRSKESLTLDVKHPQAQAILEKLIARADVFIQNLAPGAAGRLGLGAEALIARHPRLIVCDISGYGDSGPYAHKKAYDLLVQSETGVLSVTGTADSPSKVGISIADIATGMYAYSGILTALFQREKSGKGGRVEVTMFEALGEWMSYPLYYAHFGGSAPPRTGPDHATIVPYGGYRAGDGGNVMLGLQNAREWAIFCDKVLGQPALATDPRYDTNAKRLEHRDEIAALIDEAFSAMSAERLWRSSTPRASPTRASTLPTKSGIIRSSRPAIAGGSSGRPWDPCRRRCRLRRCRVSRRVWTRCRASASTARAYWASWATAQRTSRPCALQRRFERRDG